MIEIFLLKEQAQERYDICKTCEHLSSAPMLICKKCNCFAKLKTKIVDAACPAGKW